MFLVSSTTGAGENEMADITKRNDPDAGTFTRGRNAGTAKCADCGTLRQRANIDRSTGLCTECYDRAGDDNSVSDGNMTCAEFADRWGEHSTWCECESEAAQPVTTDPVVAALTAAASTLTDEQRKALIVALGGTVAK